MLEKIKQYCKDSYSEDSINSVAEVGMTNSGLFDYDETTKFSEKFHDEIWNYLAYQVRAGGYENVFAYLSVMRGDTRPSYGRDIWGEQQFEWFLAEIAINAACQIIRKEKRLGMG
jgi:hypothetical protein